MENKILLKYTNGLTIIMGKSASGKTSFQLELVNLIKDNKEVHFIHQETDASKLIGKLKVDLNINKTLSFHKTEKLGEISKLIRGLDPLKSVIFIESFDMITTKKGTNAYEKHSYKLDELKALSNLGYDIIVGAHLSDSKDSQINIKTTMLANNIISVYLNKETRLDNLISRFFKNLFKIKLKHNFIITVAKSRTQGTKIFTAIFKITHGEVNLKLL